MKHTFFTRLICLAACIAMLSLFLPSHAAFCAARTDASAQAQMLEQINADRLKNDLSPYMYSKTLANAAHIKCQDMLENGYFAHVSPRYGNVSDLLGTLGVHAPCAENIARYGSWQKAYAALMSSQSHRRNILGRGFNSVGIAVCFDPAGVCYVVQVFAAL